VARLGQVQARDAMVRLRRLDDALAQGDFYRPRDPDFRSWTGDKSPMPPAFGAGDAAGLAVYAATQQAFIDALAREAEALLPALEGSGGLMVQRWRGITVDLARYRLKSAASSLSQLEQFVVATAADVDLLNCADRIRPASRRSGDFFADQLAALQSALAARCQDLRRTETREAWSRFAEVFNRELAGRAPFRAAGAASPDRPPSDVEEGGAVLQAFDRVQRLLGARAVASEPIRRFAEQMERVRVFMAPLYPVTPEVAPGYDVFAEFRANPAQEHQGNKIIEWSLTVGTQTLRAREPARALRWEPGLPIEVRLRLARDGPVAPQAEASQPALSIEEPREVRYRFSDPWALYSFIATQREPESASRTDARSQLLRFEFPLVATGVAGLAQTQEMRARVFLRLTVSPAGKRAPLAWPGGFPARAPEWSSP
jgi:type VI secretion system protein ImpL